MIERIQAEDGGGAHVHITAHRDLLLPVERVRLGVSGKGSAERAQLQPLAGRGERGAAMSRSA